MMTADMPRLIFDSPIGRLTIFEEEGRLTSVDWGGKRAAGEPTPLLNEARRQLVAYFAGRLKAFDLPLDPAGSSLELGVWHAMCDIPYGLTRSYGELAQELSAQPRTIGQACGRNPLPVFIPCHRVLAAGGALGGYSGGRGTETKRQLLILEGALLV
jgi:methylated-DNA-[protein]-cysteine S-methyltransferase